MLLSSGYKEIISYMRGFMTCFRAKEGGGRDHPSTFFPNSFSSEYSICQDAVLGGSVF